MIHIAIQEKLDGKVVGLMAHTQVPEGAPGQGRRNPRLGKDDWREFI
jgi:hypothetical protein